MPQCQCPDLDLPLNLRRLSSSVNSVPSLCNSKRPYRSVMPSEHEENQRDVRVRFFFIK